MSNHRDRELRRKPISTNCRTRPLAQSLQYTLKAIDINPRYENALRNLEIGFDHAIEQLPASSSVESIIWKIASKQQDHSHKLFHKIIGNGSIEWHPNFFAELNSSTIPGSHDNSEELLERIGGVFFARMKWGVSTVLESVEVDVGSRIALHGLNHWLIESGLLELPVASAERLAPSPITAGERLQFAKSMNNSGIMHRRLGNFDAALHCYDLAMSLYEAAGDQKFIGNTHYNRGCVYENRNTNDDRTKAGAAFKRSLKIFRSLELDDGIQDVEAKLLALGASVVGRSWPHRVIRRLMGPFGN